MKNIIVLILIASIPAGGYGQFMAYLTKLNDSDRESAFSEITLVHRYRSAPEDSITVLGSTSFMLPKMINGKNIKIDQSRLYVRTGSAFIRDNTAYVQAFLTYDNETFDVRDDISIVALPFIVDKALIDSELQYYEGDGYVDYNFSITSK